MSKPIRKNAATLSTQERNDFVNAILALKNTKFYNDGVSNVSYWDKQNEIHSATHVHTGPLFLPWHRELCNRFEKLLQEVNPSVALHYWDFTTDPRKQTSSTPFAILNDNAPPISSYNGFLDNGNGSANTVFANFQYINPIDGLTYQISRDVDSFENGLPFDSQHVNSYAMAQPNYYTFQEKLEDLHNQIHGYIGGTINESGRHLSFCDPFVFLIHSNVDRLFAEWQIKNKNRTDPTLAYDPSYTFQLSQGTLAPWDGTVLPGQSPISPWLSGSSDVEIKTYTHPNIVAPPIYDTMDLTNLLISDFIGDTGNEPSLPPNGVYWESPDIIVRPVDDVTALNFDAKASDVTSASRLEKGQDNFIYIRVKNIGINDTSGFMYNNGNNPARDVEIKVRITPWAGSQFVFPADWTLNDPTHVFPSPDSLSNLAAVIPLNNSVIAKFMLTAQQVSDIAGWGNSGWHPCLLAHVVAANDYDHLNSITQTDNVAMRRNNLAQRNLTVVDVSPGIRQKIEFQFMAGNIFNKEKEMKLVIDKSKLPDSVHLFLAHKPELQVDFLPKKKDSFIQSPISKKTTMPLITEKKNTGEKEVAFSFAKQQGKLYALTVKVELPPTIKTGEQLPVRIMQRNVKGEVVGGVTLLINVTGKTKKSESLPSSGKTLN